ncbi:hypothetical protein [Georgenia muralis]
MANHDGGRSGQDVPRPESALPGPGSVRRDTADGTADGTSDASVAGPGSV